MLADYCIICIFSVYLPGYLHVQTLVNLHMSPPVIVAQSSSNDSAICNVLLVLWMMSRVIHEWGWVA